MEKMVSNLASVSMEQAGKLRNLLKIEANSKPMI